MLRLNPDVIPHPAWAVAVALQVAEGVYADLAGAELVITSGMEGPHVSGSAHFDGRAVDLRVKHVPEARWDALEAAMKARLPQYSVKLERKPPSRLKDASHWAPHLHVEAPISRS